MQFAYSFQPLNGPINPLNRKAFNDSELAAASRYQSSLNQISKPVG